MPCEACQHKHTDPLRRERGQKGLATAVAAGIADARAAIQPKEVLRQGVGTEAASRSSVCVEQGLGGLMPSA